MKHYYIVYGPRDYVTSTVQTCLQIGWELYGPPFSTGDGPGLIAQGLTANTPGPASEIPNPDKAKSDTALANTSPTPCNPPKQCPHCGNIVLTTTKQCDCGYEFNVVAPPPIEPQKAQTKPKTFTAAGHCTLCGNDANSHNQLGWEDLRAYRILTFPHDIIVITDALEPDMHQLMSEYNPEEGNIEGYLQREGYIAITAVRSTSSFDLS